MIKVIATGPECTGKTTLCKMLSVHFKIPYCKEYAREYLNKFGIIYQQEDLLKIAKIQLQKERELQLLDTDLITLKIWSEYKYSSCDDWILKKVEQQKKEERFYLLCKPDIAWEPDMQRENQHNRNELFNIYQNEINRLGHQHLIVTNKNRNKNIIKKVEEVLK
tara:strand:- start:5 stop:496 length:492 start_codon:yes stop_codon:yes gene_type:complete